ncbi:MAG: peptidoglycan-binding protein [Gammaproteobacteria bacterium]
MKHDNFSNETKNLLVCLAVLVFLGTASGCALKNTQASDAANESADEAKYKPVEYKNASIEGPSLIVLPGAIKSSNTTFNEQISPNNIADFAEFELERANFKVLERSDLGNLLEEIRLAANLGDSKALAKHKRGRLKTTKWFVRFDILKAEPVADAQQSFDGNAIGSIISAATGNNVWQASLSSVKSGETAKIWLIGLRYKIIDANTTEQVASGYFEEKMEMSGTSSSILGFSHTIGKQVGLDTMTQRLVQLAVADLDDKKGVPKPKKIKLKRNEVKHYQAVLNQLGLEVGVADGLFGKKTSTAISEYQRINNLTVTGYFDQPTLDRLNAPMEEKTTSNE